MKLSIVFAAFNEEKLVGSCLDAILSQNYPKEDYEIIVVDNNSTDRTSHIVREKGITPVLYDKHQGAIWAKDYGSSIAKGEIIVVTDADTIPTQGWLKNIDEIMKDPKIQCIGGTVHALGSNIFAKYLLISFDYFARMCQLFGIPFIWGCNMAFRKSAYVKVGGFNTRLKTGDDWEFVMRVQKEYGLKSALYTSRLKVKSSVRKQENIGSLIPYVSIGIINFVTLFILRKPITFGSNPVVR